MPTVEQIEERRRNAVYLEKAHIRAKTLLTCIAFRDDPANPTCPVRNCPLWQMEACRKIQKLIGPYIEQWRKEIEQRAREKERETKESLDLRR